MAMQRLRPGLIPVQARSWLVSGMTVLQLAGTPTAIVAAARRDNPNVNWRSNSVISGDFTCEGRRQHALLGIDGAQLVLAVFADGTDKTAHVIRITRGTDARLTLDTLDFEPEQLLGGPLRGFRRSSVCRGLLVSDRSGEPLHVYWNHESQRFAYWSR